MKDDITQLSECFGRILARRDRRECQAAGQVMDWAHHELMIIFQPMLR